jgi:hypothetical protein
VTVCNVMSAEPKVNNAAIAAICGSEEASSPPRSVADRIADFLDGRTNGEDLFHEFYDYVLAEPIPEQMRMLLRKR